MQKSYLRKHSVSNRGYKVPTLQKIVPSGNCRNIESEAGSQWQDHAAAHTATAHARLAEAKDALQPGGTFWWFVVGLSSVGFGGASRRGGWQACLSLAVVF